MVRRPLAIALALAATLTFAAPSQAATDRSGSDGQVRFVKRMDSTFDRYVTNTTSTSRQWLNQKFWRMEVFTPFFDSRTSWYGKGWVYADVYAIYPGSTTATQNPDWIFKDKSGNRLFIPWGCGGGTCPQYAADFTNPQFRASFISHLKTTLNKGYTGAWLDDVNLEVRVGNGNGQTVMPYSPSLGRVMTDADWRRGMADFMEEIRAAIPTSKELLHNSIWYAGQGVGQWQNADVQRQIAAADYVNLERGFNDGGLHGGDGAWSVRAVQRYIDAVHAQGKGVIVDAFDGSVAGREYSLANYLLISNGSDGVGEMSQTPDNWWKGWDTDFGRAHGARYNWQSVMRRDFEGGIALVNEPYAATRTVQLPEPMVNTAGQTVSSVTLGGGSGAVLTRLVPVVAPPTPTEPTKPVDPAPTEPTKPVDPAPTEPTKPVDPAPTQPVDPAPTEPTTPTEPAPAECKRVTVSYRALQWDNRRKRYVWKTVKTKVCIDANLKKGSRAYRKAVSSAKTKAKRSSVRKARAVRAARVKQSSAKRSAAKKLAAAKHSR